MKVAVIGFGSQGSSSLEYWQKLGDSVTLCDLNESLELPEGVSAQLGGGYLQGLDRFDLIVRSPSVHPRIIVAANPDCPDILNNVTTNTNEFMKVCPTRNIIGVTGTKGKGTTSTLITKMLESAGYRVHLGGNIGTPPLEMLKNDITPDDWVVLELANFQLIDIKYSPAIAVCLMVVAEHLDWHTTLNEYIEAKKQMFRWQKADDTAIFYAANAVSTQIASIGKAHKISYLKEPGAVAENDRISIDGHEIIKLSDIGLIGEHNWQNVCAAVTACWQITQDAVAMRNTIRHFHGLPYRIELRREVDGVTYYNDSFATGPGATVAAMAAIPAPKVMLMGGHDRGLDLSELGDALIKHSAKIRTVILYGASAERLARVLTGQGYTNFNIDTCSSIGPIVAHARQLAQPGDAVILSPAFASFDMFKNFEERGRQYNQAVEKL